MPQNSRDVESICKEFQPTCGDLTSGGNRSQRPGKIPKPDVAADSALP
jgi:hypothetical protein